jgi:hypothetical protein
MAGSYIVGGNPQAANSRSCYSNFQMLDQYTNNSETNVIVSINPVEWRVSEHDHFA